MKTYKISEEKFNQIYNETNYETDFPFVINKHRNERVGRIIDMADDSTQYEIYENFYKFDNDLQRDIVFLLLQSEYNFLGRSASYFFGTREKGDERYEGSWVDLTTFISGKNYVNPQITIFSLGKHEKDKHPESVMFKIEFYIPSYCTDDTVFEGYISSLEEFKTIWKCVGLQ